MYKIFSIGPGNESLASFLDRFKKWGIDCLVDLRSQPYSEHVPQFNRNNLTFSIKKEKIDYLYFGDKLGGRPPEGFEEYRKSVKFKENIDLLLGQIEGRTAALMCSEFDVSMCHRRFVIEEILKKNIDVMVIDKEGMAIKYVPDNSSKRHKR
jgi:uncharacterized protein (DUF488 family)